MATDEELREVVLGNRLASKAQVAEAAAWKAEHHPDKDLAEALFMRGEIDRAQVTLVRRVAKMQRKGSRPSERAPRAETATPVEEQETKELPSKRPEPELPAPTKAKTPPQGKPAAKKKPKPAAKTPAAGAQSSKALAAVSASRKLRRADPERIGRYTLIERIAKGGMGVVYKARHEELDRVFALKVLSERMANSQEALTRFQREAKIAARLDHPNVVRVHDAGADGEYAYLVMDHVDGPDLDTVIEQEGVGVRKAAQIAAAIADALDHAHGQGIVHRDVKPDNVLLDRRTGQPKITDFGIVKDLTEDADDLKLTRTGFTLGSPCYMSPEQARGQHDRVGVRSDVYSLCATLYEMLTGQPPFDGDAIHQIMVKVIEEHPAEVRTLNPSIPVDLAAIAMKGLEKDPGRRYASAKELAQDLRRFLKGDPVLAKPPGFGTKLARAARRNRTLIFLTVVLGAGLLGTGLWGWQQERTRREQERVARQEQIDQALSLVRAARKQEDASEKRRGYLDALLKLEQVLLARPDHAEALEAKQGVILELGDHLIEAGEATFAEFVFGLGQSVVDPAVIASRLAAARLGHWAEEAQERERAGDLREARRLYQSGLEELTRAGFGADYLRDKVASLDVALERERLERSLAELERLAEAAAAKGDHLAAMGVYDRACQLDPQNEDLPVKRANQERLVLAELDELAKEAATARGAALTSLGSGPDPEREDRVAALLTGADATLARGEELRSSGAYGEARVAYREAKLGFAEAASRSTAIRARTQCEQAERRAEEQRARSFAPSEFGRARELALRGRRALEAGDYEDAAQQFESAASLFRSAARTGEGKGDVSTARAAAQEVRAALHQAIGPQPELLRYQSAEQNYRQAELHFSRAEYSLAKTLYETAQEEFEVLLAAKDALLEALGLRTQVRQVRAEATQYEAARFSAEEFESGVQAQSSGEGALERGVFADALTDLGKALYRFQLALRASQPRHESMLEAQEARAIAEGLRDRVREARLTWKPDYKEGERQFRDGEGLVDEGNFKSAKRKFERAAAYFRKIEF
ncbi:MAG: protein kinase [Planctomycetota bacterium]